MAVKSAGTGRTAALSAGRTAIVPLGVGRTAIGSLRIGGTAIRPLGVGRTAIGSLGVGGTSVRSLRVGRTAIGSLRIGGTSVRPLRIRGAAIGSLRVGGARLHRSGCLLLTGGRGRTRGLRGGTNRLGRRPGRGLGGLRLGSGLRGGLDRRRLNRWFGLYDRLGLLRDGLGRLRLGSGLRGDRRFHGLGGDGGLRLLRLFYGFCLYGHGFNLFYRLHGGFFLHNLYRLICGLRLLGRGRFFGFYGLGGRRLHSCGHIVRIGHGVGLGVLAKQALLLGLLFLGAALLLLLEEFVFQLFGSLGQFVRVFTHGSYDAQHILSALQQLPGSILEFHFGHCTACTPA